MPPENAFPKTTVPKNHHVRLMKSINLVEPLVKPPVKTLIQIAYKFVNKDASVNQAIFEMRQENVSKPTIAQRTVVIQFVHPMPTAWEIDVFVL